MLPKSLTLVKLLRQHYTAAQSDLRRGAAANETLCEVVKAHVSLKELNSNMNEYAMDDDLHIDRYSVSGDSRNTAAVTALFEATGFDRLTFRICEPDILLAQREWIELLNEFANTRLLHLDEAEKRKIDAWKCCDAHENEKSLYMRDRDNSGWIPRICVFWFTSAINARSLEIPHLVSVQLFSILYCVSIVPHSDL